MQKIKTIIFQEPKKYIRLVITSVLLILVVLSIEGFNYLFAYMDAFFIAGLFMFACGGLSLINNEGMFDLFSYSGQYIVRKITGKELNRYAEYVNEKQLVRKEKKYTNFSYFIVGAVLFLIAIIISFLI